LISIKEKDGGRKRNSTATAAGKSSYSAGIAPAAFRSVYPAWKRINGV